MNDFRKVWTMVKNEGEYLNVKHQMDNFAVDTWVMGNIKVKLMDAGYTKIILAPGLFVIENYDNTITFREGSEEDLHKLVP